MITMMHGNRHSVIVNIKLLCVTYNISFHWNLQKLKI